MDRFAIVAVVVLAIAVSAFAAPSADGSEVPVGEAGLQSATERPPGAVTEVEILFGEGGEHGTGHVSWTVLYPARSPAEAVRADDDSLAVDWFRGSEYVRAAVEAREGSRVTGGGVEVYHTTSGPPSGGEPDHGWVVVEYRPNWEGVFAGDRSRVVVGPAFAAALSDGDSLTVRVPKSWPAASANAERRPAGEVFAIYHWTIGEDPTPRIVLDESVLDGGVPVPGPGPALAMVAVLATGTFVVAVRRR